MTPRTCLCCAFVWAGLCLGSAGAQPFANREVPEFLRVFAPANRISEWPLAGDKYLPIEGVEFERLADLIERGRWGVSTTSRCRIRTLAGVARVEKGTMRGSITLEIVHDGGGPALLPLDPWRLAMTDARWESPQSATAICGLTGGGRTGVAVSRGGRLRIDFSLRGQATSAGDLEYRLVVPDCVGAAWEIAFGAGDDPMIEGGLVDARGDDSAVYRIHVLPGETIRILTRAEATSAHRKPFASTNQALTYALSTNGVEVVSEFHFEQVRATPGRMIVALDAELKPVSVQFGQRGVEFQRLPDEAGQSRIEFAAPESLSNEDPLRVTAWCPLRAGQRWEMPGMRVADAAWKDATINVLLPEPLGLTQLFSVYGLRQTGVHRLALPLNGESLTFDCYSPATRLAWRIDFRSPTMTTSSGTTVEVGPREMTARMLCDVQVANGEVFELRGRISPGWLLHDVSSAPDRRVREFERDSQDPGRIVIRLNSAIKARQDLRLEITARRPNPRMGEPQSLVSLAPVTLDQVAHERRLFSLRSPGEQRWRLRAGEAAKIVERDQLESDASELLLPTADETLVAVVGEDDGSWAMVEPRSQRLRADSLAEFTATPDQVEERYELRCDPEQGSVDSLTVRFSQRREAPPHWSCAGSSNVSVTATMATEPLSEVPTTETWVVRIWPPQSAPFVLNAWRRVPTSGATHLALVELPEADAESGVARIMADDSLALEVDAVGPHPVVPELSRLGEGRVPPRAEYRFQPARDVSRAAPPALSVTVRPRSAHDSKPIVRHESIAATMAPDGDCLVTARYRLEGPSAALFECELPQSSTLLRVTQPAGTIRVRRNQDVISVDVGQLDVRQELVVEYSVPCLDRLRMGVLGGILPRIAQRFHPRSCQLELPSGWEMIGVDAPWQCAQLRAQDALVRLFGPLAGTTGDWTAPPSLSEVADTIPRDVNTYRIVGPSHGEPSLRVQSRTASRQYTIYASIVAGLACWQLGRRNAKSWFVAPLVAASTALLVPGPLIPWATGAFLGAVASAFVGLLWRSGRHPRFSPAPRSDAAGSTTRTMVLGARHAIWMPLLLLASGGHAADIPAPAAPPRVFIPVDDDQQPTGGRYFVSERLWRTMQERAVALGDEHPEWIVSKAQYTLGNASRPLDANSVLHAQLEVHTFAPDVRVALPCAATFASRMEALRLDGASIPIAADDDPSQVSFEAPETGVHRVELAYPATVTALQDHTALDFAAMGVPCSSLQAWLSPAALAGSGADALGESKRNAADGRLTCALGPASSFRFRLSRTSRDAAQSSPVEVEQLLWLQIEPERVTAEVRHQIVAADRPLGQLELNYDPRWESSGAAALDGPRERPGLSPGRTLLEWISPGTVGQRFSWHCAMRDRAGVGEIALPQVTPVGAVVRRRWCAVTLDSALETTSLANSGAAGPTPAQFLAAWGPTDVTPRHVFAWPVGGPPPNLQTAFVQSHRTADERVTVIVHADRMELKLAASIDDVASPVFGHRVVAPRELDIQSLEIEQDGVQRTARWTRGEKDEIQIFFAEPVSGPHTLALRGVLPIESQALVRLRQFGLLDAEIRSRFIRLERHRSALIDELAPAPQFGADSDAAAGSLGNSQRPIGEWPLPQSLGVITFRVRPNAPRTTALQTVSIHDDGQGARAEVECRLAVSDGTVDELRFDVPRSWSGPFELEPNWPHELLTSQTASVQTLVVRPPNGIGGDQRLSIRGPIDAAGGSPIVVPEVTLQGIGRLQRLIVLPEQLSDRRIFWSLEGVRPAALPAAWIHRRESQTTWRAYDVIGESFSASSRPAEQPLGRPEIRLSSYALRVEADGEYRGLATWALDPGGLSHLPLRLPPGAELLSCRVLGQRVDVRKNAAESWAIPLQSDQFPQSIELLYGGRIDATQSQPAPAPEIPDAPVTASQWTIIGPMGEFVDDTTPRTTALQQSLDRCRCAAELLELGVQRTAIHGTHSASGEGRRWFDKFVGSYAASRAAAAAAAEESRDRAEARLALTELEKLDRQLATQFADDSALANSITDAVARASGQREIPALDEGLRHSSATSHSKGTGQSPRIWPGATFRPRWKLRAAGAAAFLALGVLLMRDGRVSQAMLASLRWPLVWWFTLGLVWWLWLAPSVLGLLIMAYAAWLLFQQRREATKQLEMAP